MTSLTGQLLVATPRITEPMFRRSVVLLLHHDEGGAHGVVLNKPLGVDVDRVLPGWSSHLSGPGELFQGGPVGLDTALGLGWVVGVEDREGAGAPSIHRLFAAVGFVDLDAEPEQVARHTGALRIFAGYSGWGAGQLEAELGEGSWYVVSREPTDPFTGEPGTLWRRVLRRQPGRLAFVAHLPEDPERN
ncbi:MAG: YqgE/AlgH family protein [Nocardioidaceae bacterium]|nr:YqgE/AlgH family protein [Nocardioidaceae bacterium]